VFVVLLLLIVFFAEISYRFVETPFRQSSSKNLTKLSISKTVPTILVFLSIGIVALRPDVVAKELIEPKNYSLYFYDAKKNCWFDADLVTCGEELNESILLVGDSHAASLRPGFFEAINSINHKPRFRDGRCLFASFDRNINAAAEDSGCDEFGVQLQEEIIAQQPRIVVLLICGRIHDSCPQGLESENEVDWVDAGTKALQPILDAGISVALVRDLPVLEPDPRYSATVFRSIFDMPINQFEINRRYQQLSMSRFETLLTELSPSKGKIYEVSVLDSVCDEKYCEGRTSKGSEMWSDEDHLSIDGSLEIADVIARELSLIIKD
jgi:hypothetical protein